MTHGPHSLWLARKKKWAILALSLHPGVTWKSLIHWNKPPQWRCHKISESSIAIIAKKNQQARRLPCWLFTPNELNSGASSALILQSCQAHCLDGGLCHHHLIIGMITRLRTELCCILYYCGVLHHHPCSLCPYYWDARSPQLSPVTSPDQIEATWSCSLSPKIDAVCVDQHLLTLPSSQPTTAEICCLITNPTRWSCIALYSIAETAQSFPLPNFSDSTESIIKSHCFISFYWPSALQ